MQDLPHHYEVTARAEAEGDVTLSSGALPALVSAPPASFGGPGDRWSPEDLLAAAVADCFILTFRAIARASRLEWQQLECSAEGLLERVERSTRFTAFTVRASLTVAEGVDSQKAQRLLEKAEAACLVTSSLNAEIHLESEVLQS